MTNDDLLPVIEIDENYPNNFYNELPWLLKISCNWDIVKALRNEMEKYSSSVNQFRLKLLSAISQMQSAIGLKDLGYFYFKSLQDSQGTVVLSCINYIKVSRWTFTVCGDLMNCIFFQNPKSISVLNSRWIPLRKIQRKVLPISDASSANEIILASIPQQIEFYQAADVKLSKGLYVGYLKMHCSMEQMHVVVPTKTPNVLPHCKIRDNPHVCAEEWAVLQESFDPQRKTETQRRFLDALSVAAVRVFKYMGVPTECMLKHKLFNLELIHHSHDVSFLVICPPIELSCAAPGQREMLLQRADLVSVPTQAFEMCQMFTYNSDNIRKCARLSIVVDLETAEANHLHREAFSTVEAHAAKEHLDQLQDIKCNLADYWKSIRWLLDVMTFTRNRCTDTGVSMRSILNVDTPPTERVAEKRDEQSTVPSFDVNFLSRRSPCRLSWPNNNRKEHATTELSKSDQQLNFVMSKMSYRRTADVDTSRRNSADAHCLIASEESLNCFVDRYSLCKSDETLMTSGSSFSPLLQRKRSKTISARICSSKCVQCGNSSSAHHSHRNGRLELDNQGAQVTCIVSNHSNDEQCKITKIEPFGSEIDKENFRRIDNNVNVDASQFGTIQVYVANETGAGNGLCLRLHVTTQTTAREIIDLVVKQCNRSVLQTVGKSIGAQLDSNDFCLFAIFGNRGRCVPDNFRPLQLQNPWKKGRLYVRRTHVILAEIEQSERGVHAI